MPNYRIVKIVNTSYVIQEQEHKNDEWRYCSEVYTTLEFAKLSAKRLIIKDKLEHNIKPATETIVAIYKSGEIK